MTIKIKMRGNDKAIIRFNNQMEQQFFVHIMRQHRDNGQGGPRISIKNVNGEEYPIVPKQMPVVNQQAKGPTMVPQGQPVIQSFKPPAMLGQDVKLGEATGMEVKTIPQSKKEISE